MLCHHSALKKLFRLVDRQTGNGRPNFRLSFSYRHLFVHNTGITDFVNIFGDLAVDNVLTVGIELY
ncbi:MAG: hypothetical protein ABI045_02515 [Flavobacteriales bacterium]